MRQKMIKKDIEMLKKLSLVAWIVITQSAMLSIFAGLLFYDYVKISEPNPYILYTEFVIACVGLFLVCTIVPKKILEEKGINDFNIMVQEYKEELKAKIKGEEK